MRELKNMAKYMPLAELKKLENNPRTIKKADFEKLKTSIKDNPEFFEAHPIIASDRTGENVIIAGNQRWEAAKALGMEEVPVVVLHGLSEKKEREIIIRSNVENGDWDFDILANLWDEKELEEWGVDNIKTSIKDEKDIENDAPTITASFITLDYNDEIQLAITDETAVRLMDEMIQYNNNHGSYDGFWDKRLNG